jgi:3-oxoacyl-[acyl-carrier protein] reductase
VTANVVHPPMTDTGWITEDIRRFVATSGDHVHVAAPAEVAEVIAWLCTDAFRLVTGNRCRCADLGSLRGKRLNRIG